MGLVLTGVLGCGKGLYRVGMQELHSDQAGGAGSEGSDRAGSGGKGGAGLGGSSSALAGVSGGGLGSGGKLTGQGGEGTGGEGLAGTGGTGGTGGMGAMMGGTGGTAPMVPGPGCIVDGGGMCVGLPSPLLNVPGCEKLEVYYASQTLYALSTGTRQLFYLKDGTNDFGEIPSVLSDGVTEGLPTAFAVDLDERYAFVAVGLALVRVDLRFGGTTGLTREAEPIVDLNENSGVVTYVHGAAVSSIQGYSPGDGITGLAADIDGAKPSAIAVNSSAVVWASSGSSSVRALSTVGRGEIFTVAPSQGNLVLGHRALQTDTKNVFWMNFGLKRANVAGTPADTVDVVTSFNGDMVAFALDSSDVATQAYVATSGGTIEYGVIRGGITNAPTDGTVLARDLGTVTSVAIDPGRIFVATADCNLSSVPRPTPPP